MTSRTSTEAMTICKLGKGPECCAYLVAGSDFACAFKDADNCKGLDGRSLAQQVKDGTMAAKGLGGWEGCLWEGEG